MDNSNPQSNVAPSFNPNIEEKNSVVQTGSGKPGKTLVIILSLIVVLLAGALTASIILLNKEKNKSINPTELATAEQERIKEAVGKLIILDDSTEPTIATLVDTEKLKQENSEFYKNAKNGDKLLIYPDRAILFDEEKNIIVNVAPILKEPVTNTTTDENTLTIELRNGSKNTENLTDVNGKITELGESYIVSNTTEASNTNYTGTVIYNLGNADPTLLTDLAEKLNAKIETALPEGEAESTAGVVIIVGE